MPRRGMAWLPEDWEQFVRSRQRPPAPHTSSGSGAVRRRTTPPPRRAATIAAFTTGTLAASTAAFAATVPGGTDGAASLDAGATPIHEAAMVGGHGAVGDLTRARTLAPLATAIADHDPVFTNVSITADKSAVAPNTPVVLTVRATEADSGAPLSGQDVRIVVVNGPQWQTSTRLHTDANGTAQITARLLSTTTITAVFDGSNALRPSLAGAATVTITSPLRGAAGLGGSGSGSVIDQAIPTVIPGSSIGEKAVYLASLNKGKPYVWGAEGPYSFDCSGLVQYVFKQLGRSLPRTAQGQYNVSTKVPQSGKQPGDLIFYGTPGNIYHVGIYAGNGYMWAAPQTGGVVSLRPIYSSTYKVGRIH
ncbi:cell wall-associated hydrolase, invasion-associated protein [Frankia torreyi]|uniref:Cell wall-associated hydrolase, invasion-associated protein n=1 Tax=Frankia torreyi TaxID=1856 RepID=A0A0D8BLK2_9ACTN|nr:MULTISPECIES: NlpC/P60 family protein [Frankia]KJE24889.1 cell wall-associated hydrolase, invasion-associated protein [Frankia torreyi]KQC39272.1 glycoside hydrolase [Frankia sp. ACN1ag]KQM06941.1 cell wall-associated hydrolase, invasion-associated protein [Frankia sp. CpI1-P]